MSKFQKVRMKRGKIILEVMTHPGTVLKYRAKKLSFDKVLLSDVISSVCVCVCVCVYVYMFGCKYMCVCLCVLVCVCV